MACDGEGLMKQRNGGYDYLAALKFLIVRRRRSQVPPASSVDAFSVLGALTYFFVPAGRRENSPVLQYRETSQSKRQSWKDG